MTQLTEDTKHTLCEELSSKYLEGMDGRDLENFAFDVLYEQFLNMSDEDLMEHADTMGVEVGG